MLEEGIYRMFGDNDELFLQKYESSYIYEGTNIIDIPDYPEWTRKIEREDIDELIEEGLIGEEIYTVLDSKIFETEFDNYFYYHFEDGKHYSNQFIYTDDSKLSVKVTDKDFFDRPDLFLMIYFIFFMAATIVIFIILSLIY